MFGALLVFLLQAPAPQASGSDPAPATQEAPETPVTIAPGMMACQPWDQGTRTRICTTAEGEVLRCRRERTPGTRFRSLVCLSHRQDQQLTEDTRRYLDRQQHIEGAR